MSKPKVNEDGNKIYIERGDEFFEITVTHEGIIVDVYGDKGNVHIGSPFAATWDEMIPEETDNNNNQ
ncbi:MAG: hypothetical protein VXZ72_05240 [Chlamydiota bacterium]|nr:hypothetical protein [Chlamydiota bacterium]